MILAAGPMNDEYVAAMCCAATGAPESVSTNADRQDWYIMLDGGRHL